jgi:hypothetical protein
VQDKISYKKAAVVVMVATVTAALATTYIPLYFED